MRLSDLDDGQLVELSPMTGHAYGRIVWVGRRVARVRLGDSREVRRIAPAYIRRVLL